MHALMNNIIALVYSKGIHVLVYFENHAYESSKKDSDRLKTMVF